MITSLYRETTRAISLIASRFPIPISLGPRKSAWPPIHVNPVSNEIRVRADGLAKIMAKD